MESARGLDAMRNSGTHERQPTAAGAPAAAGEPVAGPAHATAVANAHPLAAKKSFVTRRVQQRRMGCRERIQSRRIEDGNQHTA